MKFNPLGRKSILISSKVFRIFSTSLLAVAVVGSLGKAQQRVTVSDGSTATWQDVNNNLRAFLSGSLHKGSTRCSF